MRRLFALSLLLSGCATSQAITAPSVLEIRGSNNQITALLADGRYKSGILRLLSDKQGSGGSRTLRYLISETTPYRDVGGLVYDAQRHGVKIKIKKAQ